MEWMLLPFKRYFDFSGRSRRKEYWLFLLFTVIVSFVLGFVDEVLGLKFGEPTGSTRDNGVLGSIFSLATLVPSIAVAVRRLHDTDRTGWWVILPVVVIIVGVVIAGVLGAFSNGMFGVGAGAITAVVIGLLSVVVLLVFFCLDGTRGPNRYGDDPKGVDFAGVFE